MNKTTDKRRVIRLLATGVCLSLLVAYCIGHASDLRVLSKFRVFHLAALVALVGLANLITAYKMFLMLRWVGLQSTSFLRWLHVFAGSRLANFYVTQGANVYRAVRLKREYALSYSESVGLTAVVACFDTASILFITGLLILGVRGFESRAGFFMLGAAFAIVSPLLIVPRLVRPLVSSEAPQRPSWLVWLSNRMRVFSKVLACCTHDGWTMGAISGMTILVYLAVLAGTAICLTAFGEHVSMFNVALLTSVLTLSRTINIVPGNLGVSELLAGASTGLLMDQAMYGVMIAAIFRIVDFAVIGIAFLVLTIRPRATTNRHSIGTG